MPLSVHVNNHCKEYNAVPQWQHAMRCVRDAAVRKGMWALQHLDFGDDKCMALQEKACGVSLYLDFGGRGSL